MKELLFDYVKSPSLRHIRDPHSVIRLAQEIDRRIDRGRSIWRKWDGQRELLLKSALCCWIPVADMRDFLNAMPGPPLTTTDVAQRLKALDEEEHYDYPREEVQAGCLAIYEKEKADGTELPAIIQLLRDHVEKEEDRLRAEQQENYRRWREEARFFARLMQDQATVRAVEGIIAQRNHLAHGRQSLPITDIKKFAIKSLQLESWGVIPETDGDFQIVDRRPWATASSTTTGQIGLFERWQKNALRCLVPETGEIFKVPRSSTSGGG